MPRKLLPTLLICFIVNFSFAQPFQNKWIDYNKSYYKFKLGPFGYDNVGAPIKKGVVRISQQVLLSAGLGTVHSQNFQLWYHGKEVTLYISKAFGILSSSDYIEFWGQIEDGEVDKNLYRDSAFQLSDYWSLVTDSASYYLTENKQTENKRFDQVNNNVSNNVLQPETNFIHKLGRYFRYGINEGYGIVLEQNLYLSSYDRGEGWSSRPVRPVECGCGQSTLPQYFPELNMDTTDGGVVSASVNMVGNAPNDRAVKISFNGTPLTQINMGYFQSAKVELTDVAANSILNDAVGIEVQNLSAEPYDELRVAQIVLTYPHSFNFGNATDFKFSLPAATEGRYIKIANFSSNGGVPILYDLANNNRYIANTDIADTFQFVLIPSSVKYQLVLVRGDGTTATNISKLTVRNFIDFSKPSKQGNYLIISNPLLYAPSPNNYVEQYRKYRASEKGGNFNSIIIDIEELEDQFALGVKKHPLAIKDFLRYARLSFIIPPAYVFLIGKGAAYTAFRPYYGQDPGIDELNLVPVFGSPGSDNLLASDDFEATPATPIGRLSAITPEEVGDYLAKVKQYEAAQNDAEQTIENKGWMKNVLQLTGANDPVIGTLLDINASKYKRIIMDTLFGANVINYSKTANPSGYAQAIVNFENTFNSGASVLEYFGHSSAASLDFSLTEPANYSNTGKYPFFIVNGCLAGNIFDFDGGRFINKATISEKFVLEPQKGAIAYLATSSYGVVSYLDIFTKQFYKSIAQRQYGNSLGEIVREGIYRGLNIAGNNDFYGKMHAEQYTLHGDPALKINSFNKPDYAVQANRCEAIPSFISTADKSFAIKIRIYNLGSASNDSVHFSLYRRFGVGDSTLVFSKELSNINNVDSLIITLPIISNEDEGKIKLFALIDDNNKIDELSEKNNKAKIVFDISSAEIRPIFPYNFGIVNSSTISVFASTANPLDTLKQYILEMDTTALFNSQAKISRQKLSVGGVLEFKNLALPEDNRVYYWRVAPLSDTPHWNTFSFTHKTVANDGVQQAHYFQHTQSNANNIVLDSSRQYSFASKFTNLYILHSIYPTSGTEDNEFSVSVNGSYVAASACVGHSVIFNVFDPLTFKPIPNTTNPYGAAESCKPLTINDFEFSVTESESRKNAMDFLDNFVQDGYYVVARKIYDDWADNGVWAPTTWAADTAIYGHNNSLYHRFKDQGLSIDSFYFPRTFIFVFRKNDSTDYQPISVFSKGFYDKISLSENLITKNMAGSIESPTFGPAKSWNRVVWNGFDLNSNNTANLEIIGISKNGKDSVFYTLDKSQASTDISTIKAATYPYLKLRMETKDSVTAKPYQLQDWLVEYSPVAEGAIAPNIGVALPEKLIYNHDINIAYDTLKGYVVFKNVSTKSFKPLKLQLLLYNDNNIPYSFNLLRTRMLPPGDTLHISFLANVTELPAGMYNLFIKVNADDDQPEQFYFNNLLFQFLEIKRVLLPAPQFSAKPSGKNSKLNWVVDDEIGIDQYELEFSKDCKQFENISTEKIIPAPGKVGNHSFLHNSTVNGNNYYRLKTVYKDGHITYSAIRIVNFNTEVIVNIYPNPIKNELNISVDKQEDTKNTVRVFGLNGRQLMQQSFDVSTRLNVSTLAAGTYMVQVDDGKTIRSFKVQKQ